MEPPALAKPIPAQITNERAAYGPFDLKQFIQAPDNSVLTFQAELSTGESLPQGMICTGDGIVTGIPAKDTHGNYEIHVTALNEAGSVDTTFTLTIKPSLLESTSVYADELKAQIWEAMDKNLPIPDLGEMFERPVTIQEIYYLLERWGILRIWDAFNLEPAGEKHLLTLEGASKHYNVYDRGSCIVAAPKDLFSHERTIEDGLQTARAMAREVYKRGWTIELVGLDKLTRAAWVELQRLRDIHGRQLEVINFNPTLNDLKLYSAQSKVMPGMDLD